MNLTPSSSGTVASPPYTPVDDDHPSGSSTQQRSRLFSSDFVTESPPPLDNLRSAPDIPTSTSYPSNLRPSFSLSSFRMKSAGVSMSQSISEHSLRQTESSMLRSQETRKLGSPGKLRRSVSMMDTSGVRYAGEASVYYDPEVSTVPRFVACLCAMSWSVGIWLTSCSAFYIWQGLLTWTGGMIRERVSTQGIIRPLEPVDKLDALHMPPAIIGVLSERAVRRYLEGKAFFDQKYAKELLTVEKQRNRNIDLAKKDITRNFTRFQESRNGRSTEKQMKTPRTFRDGLESPSGAWGWVWADERPPPSSIVSRRDTDESRRLALIACRSVLQDEDQMNGNNLLAAMANLLTKSPPKSRPASDSEATEPPVERTETKKSKSVFASLRIREKQ